MSQNGAIGFSAVPGGCGDSGFSSPAFVTWYCLVMWFVTLYFLVMLFVRWYCICHMVLPLSRGIILSHCLSCGIAFVTWFVTFYFLVTLFVTLFVTWFVGLLSSPHGVVGAYIRERHKKRTVSEEKE